MKNREINIFNKGLFNVLVQTHANKVFLAIVLGMLAGMAYTMIIPLVTTIINKTRSYFADEVEQPVVYFLGFEVSNAPYALIFLLVCLFIFVTRTTSHLLLQQVAIETGANIRNHFYRKIANISILNLEKVGPARIHAAIASDVPEILNGASAFPAILVSSSTIVGLLGFLIYLDFDVFIFVMATILFGIVTYSIPLYFAQRYLRRAREEFDGIQEGIRNIIYGAKEVRLNHRKAETVIGKELKQGEQRHASNAKTGALFIVSALNYGNLISFAAIGVATFILSNHFAISSQILASIVMAMLYISGPLAAIMNSISPITKGNVALDKLNSLFEIMPENHDHRVNKDFVAPRQMESIQLQAVEFHYHHDDGNETSEDFAVGPLDLEFEKGKITFLVGGNGSGKSTVAKITSLLYDINQGEILFDGTVVNDKNLTYYRNSISAIFTDYYLSRVIYDLDASKEDQILFLLKELDLEEKVKIENSQFNTINLSDGQRKRLALLIACLEDRPVYIFDEWAADQDPRFKDVFYRKILPGLREKGKLIIVVTHDDKYFHLADKLVKMESGRIAEIYQSESNKKVEPVELCETD